MTIDYKTTHRAFAADGVDTVVCDLCVPELSDCGGAASINGFFTRVTDLSTEAAEKAAASVEASVKSLGLREKLRYKTRIFKLRCSAEASGSLLIIKVSAKLSRGGEVLSEHNARTVWDIDSGLLSRREMKKK